MGPPDSRRRGPYAKTRERREAVLAAVFELVSAKGHRQVTTAEIAERAGTSEATVLYHFPSKEHLYVEMLAYARAQAESGPPPDVSTPAAVERYLDYIVADKVVDTHQARLYTSLMAEAAFPEHPGHAAFAARNADVTRFFTAVIGDLQASGQITGSVDPAVAAQLFLAAWDGLQSHWLISQDFDLVDAVVSAFRLVTGRLPSG